MDTRARVVRQGDPTGCVAPRCHPGTRVIPTAAIGAVVHAPREPVDFGRHLGNMVVMVEVNR